MKIGVIVGSLRKESYNRKMAKILMQLAPSSLEMEIIEIADLPLYNEDSDKNPPEAWLKFRDRVKACDGILFMTPEYNRSIPGVLKNAIDVASRPYGSSVWDKKPAAIMSVSPGAIGGFGANHHLRQCLVFLNMPCLQQPEAYIGGINKMMDEQGKIADEGTKKFLKQFIDTYANWVETTAATAKA